jgi:O-antigen/teichoic acid export membrane protein
LSEHSEARPSALSRLPIPEGTLPVGVGLLVAGISSYLFFKVAGDQLGNEGFKPVNALWFATFALAPGFFLPVEQEMGRALAHRESLGQGGRPVVKKLAVLAVGLMVIVCLLLAIFGKVIAKHYFDDNWVMTVSLIVAFAAYAPAHLSRGICSGNGRFGGYAVIMGFDGGARILGCVGLALLGVKTAGPYGVVIALAPLTGLALVYWRKGLVTEPGPEATWKEVTPNLGWLLLGSVFGAALLNAGPIATNLLATTAEEGRVSQFGYGVLLSRIPLFLFQAVQAALLPRLARLAAQGDQTEFRTGFRHLLILVCGVGLLGTIGSLVFGPTILKKVFDADLSGRTLTLLALGSACYMVAVTAAQAVIALHGHAVVALGWTLAMVGFVATTALMTGDTFRRVEVGLLVGSAVGMVTFLVALAHKLRHHAPIDRGSVLEAISDIPFEG